MELFLDVFEEFWGECGVGGGEGFVEAGFALGAVFLAEGLLAFAEEVGFAVVGGGGEFLDEGDGFEEVFGGGVAALFEFVEEAFPDEDEGGLEEEVF